MALDWVQRRLFIHTVDLYKPVPMVGGRMTDGATGSMRHVLAYSAVQCYLAFTMEFVQPGPPGRTKTINFETLDTLHVQISQEVADGWKFKFTTAGHAEINGWWDILGNAKSLDLANTRELYSRRSLSPPMTVTV